MSTRWLSLMMVLLSSQSWAQVGELYNAELTADTKVTNPAEAIKTTEGQWLAFSIPALAGTRSPCCWKGKWITMGETGCSLKSGHQSYGTRSDSPMAENLIVFSQIRDSKIENLRVVGESCPVDANGQQVTRIGSIDDAAGLEWLESVARAGRDHKAGGSALFALALHRSPQAGQRLYALAKEADGDISEAIVVMFLTCPHPRPLSHKW